MSTKLNAEELAAKRKQNTLWNDDMERAYAAAIREHSQPLADKLDKVTRERDELRDALIYMVSIAEDQGWTDDFLRIPRTILAKYPKP